MVKVVSWNIGKREKPWRELMQMASEGAADVALLQEAGSPPGDVVDRIEYMDGVFWNRQLYDRWPLVVKLSDRITVEPYRQTRHLYRSTLYEGCRPGSIFQPSLHFPTLMYGAE